MALASQSLHVQFNSDGSLDFAYPTGAKPTGGAASLSINLAAFNAAGIDLTRRSQNTAISINYRTYLQGTSAATAILRVNAVSGSLGGWTTGTDVLQNPGTSLGSGSIQVTADDGAGTVVAFPAQPWSVVAATRQKWAPGWGMVLDIGSGGGGLSGWLSQIAAIKNEPNITCVLYRDFWTKFEDAAGGTYANGFSTCDQLIAACAAAGKKFAWALAAERYGSSVPSTASGTLPTYFESLVCSDAQSPGYVKWPGGTAWSGNLILCANLWDSVVMDKFIALHTAYATRYETNPTVLMCHGPGETSHAVPVNQRGYTAATLTTQLTRWLNAAPALWPTTIKRLETNYLVTSDHVREQQLVTLSNQLDIANGGPDVKSSTVTTNAMFTGSFAGSTDLRGINCFVTEIQSPDFNPYTATTAMQALWNIAESGALSTGGSTQAQYYFVLRNNWNGSPRSYPLWDANILPFIRANPVPRSAYPSGW